MLLSGGQGCRRTFKSLLKGGLITTMCPPQPAAPSGSGQHSLARRFDPVAFASPAHEQDSWRVVQESGKTVDIPRPVHEIRVWDAASRAYTAIEARMGGAPDAGSEDAYWVNLPGPRRATRRPAPTAPQAELLAELRQCHGSELVDSLLADDA